MSKDLNRHFSEKEKKDIPVSDKHTKRCSTSLNTREVNTKWGTTLHPVGIYIVKKKKSVDKNVEV